MNKTKVDDMLIEMISPKVKEIEEKFGNGGVLTQEDINTLLLKSQYNHINHLDMKLDEVTADVGSLKASFKDLEYSLSKRVDKLENKFDRLEMTVKNELSDMRKDMFNIQKDNENLQLNIKKDNESLKKDLELKIAETINSNMKWSIGLIAFIVTVLKIIDMILMK
jgi:predicted RNase H-like nuclease (RuvC/YqgF family)